MRKAPLGVGVFNVNLAPLPMADRISILIITYNRPADLLELLMSLSAQTNIGGVLEEMEKPHGYNSRRAL